MWINYILFILSSVTEHLDCFQFSSVMHNVAMNAFLQVFVSTYFHIYVIYIYIFHIYFDIYICVCQHIFS